MSRKQKKELIRICISSALFITGLIIPYRPAALLCLCTAYGLIGFEVLKESASGIIHGQVFDENFLMTIATVGAIVIGEYHEAVAVMLFYQVGEWFQRYAVGKSRASIAELMDICPETATVERNGTLEEVQPDEVEIGEILVLRAGDRVPLDGTVIEGTSTLDTAALTGESLPRSVQAGDEVISGCINGNGVLHVRTTKRYEDSTVARILELVENASDKKARMESFIARFARVYTPAVCAAALLLFVLPPLFTGGNWAVWGYRALSFLVVSCPCALVISVPLSFFGGIGAASRNGILVKGSNYLEALAKAKVMLFDKTGTLTEGTFRVASLHPLGVTERELLCAAAAVEQTSTHPLSRAICAAYPDEADPSALHDVQEIAGQGVKARYQANTICVGNASLMAACGIHLPADLPQGTLVHVARNGEYLGCITFEDVLKPSAPEAIRALKEAGVQDFVLLSGDHEAAARQVAAQLGLNRFHAQLLPQQKVEHVETMLSQKASNETLVFVGDGINDAPVLTRVDVGVAMGALGSDAAVEAADVVLMDDDPTKLALAVKISRRTVGIARQNILFALGVKLLVLVLVALGVSGMWMAVFADVGVSVLAILNAMRTLKVK